MRNERIMDKVLKNKMNYCKVHIVEKVNQNEYFIATLLGM